ncbi:hypothetical protein OH456_03640 [Vibrio sp. La 4.2.2]|uniref:hypothetical protein n=1 Tax=Vibrio sp. La 4.2.2 TaxID=2998830 RepID=UPI0022CDBDE3|nr:hypothetical protein [Vibrio sp. La 4.2.2]MDA0107225.1 hypothetical protein [Vibrio sp. La 4.2.2]
MSLQKLIRFSDAKLAAISLCILSPIIAEYLLGIWSLTQLSSLLFLVPFYGCGALLVREIARRSGSGWVGIFALSFAFGLIEEGLLTQTFFNTDYYHAGLLSFGYIESLGTSPFWIIYVLGLHSLGSICLPILMVELRLDSSEREKLWLNWPSFFVCTTLYFVASASIFLGTQQAFPYQSTLLQKLAVITVIIAFSALALFRLKIAFKLSNKRVSNLKVFITTIILGVVFFGQHYHMYTLGLSEHFVAFSMLSAYLLGMYFMLRWSQCANWSDSQQYSMVFSLLVIYSVLGLYQFSKYTTALGHSINYVDIALQIGLILALTIPVLKKIKSLV